MIKGKAPVLYVPGLGDERLIGRQQRYVDLLNRVRSPEHQITLFDPKWFSNESYADKRDRLYGAHANVGELATIFAFSAGVPLTNLLYDQNHTTPVGEAHMVCGWAVNADEIGYDATELQSDINSDPAALAKLESIRAHGAVQMGLIKTLEEAAARQHTPKVAFVAPAKQYTSSSGKTVTVNDIDLNVRAMSMGQLHHAMMGTAAVAISIASAIPGTLVNLAAGGGERDNVRFGHPSGTLKVGGQASFENGQWTAKKAIMSRSARVLMEGNVRVPGDSF